MQWNSVGAEATHSAEGSEAIAGRWRDLALTKDCEEGFRRFMHMAETGQLGSDVTNANVGVFKNHARVELVRGAAPIIVLFLSPPQPGGGNSRYFTVEPGPRATADDVGRVARALDAVFREDPFELAYDFFNASPGGAPIPSLWEAAASDGWRGVVRVLARQTASLASAGYTMVVIVLVSTALIANLLLLWGSTPRR
jgi:hypothetical protein